MHQVLSSCQACWGSLPRTRTSRMAPLFLAKGGGCCMPHGACTLLRGPTNGPKRLLVAAYVATTVSLTSCRATTIRNGPQATQQAPTVKMTAGAPVCMTGPACHSMQQHGQPTALSQQFPFAPSERERLCTLLRVCIHRWGRSEGPQNLSTGQSQPLQHATAWAANSSVTAVLVRS